MGCAISHSYIQGWIQGAGGGREENQFENGDKFLTRISVFLRAHFGHPPISNPGSTPVYQTPIVRLHLKENGGIKLIQNTSNTRGVLIGIKHLSHLSSVRYVDISLAISKSYVSITQTISTLTISRCILL